MAIGCFMITWQVAAQTFGSNRTGNYYDGWVINAEDSNHWSFLRFQVSNDRAWNIVNQGDLWWGYAPNNNDNDRGTEKMKLTTDGNLIVSGNASVARTLTTGIRNGAYPDFIDWTNTRGIILGAETDNAFFGLVNRSGENGGNNDYNTVIYFGDDSSDDLEFRSQDFGELMRLTGDGMLGIGTAIPSTMLDVAGTGHFSGNVGIGTSSPSAMLDVVGTGHFSGNVGIGTTTPRGTLDVDGSGDIYLVDDPVDGGGTQILFAPGNFYLAPYNGSDISYIQAKRQNSTGSSHMRFRTFGNGQSNDAMHIDDQGNVGINNTAPTEKLDVDGTVKATSFVSSAASFPDYVFAADYKITPLSDLEAYVKKHNRLPNMPSEKEVVEQGLNVPDVVVKSVENIETIYLHLIRMEKEIKALQQENATLKQQLKKGR